MINDERGVRLGVGWLHDVPAAVRVRDALWHAERRGGIGGSDAGIILGISPFKTRLRLWKEKRGEVDAPDMATREHIYWGHRLERIIAEEYEIRTGHTISAPTELCRHASIPWMICNPDGFVTSARHRVIAEIKNVSTGHFASGKWGDDGTSKIPPYYYAQAQHNMEVTRAIQCDFPILIGGSMFRLYFVPRDDEFIARLVRIEREFWESLTRNDPPEPVNSDDLKLLFPNANPELTIDAEDEGYDTVAILESWAGLCAARRDLKNIKGQEKQWKFELERHMGEASFLMYGNTELARWRNEKRGRILRVKMPPGMVPPPAPEENGDGDDE